MSFTRVPSLWQTARQVRGSWSTWFLSEAVSFWIIQSYYGDYAWDFWTPSICLYLHTSANTDTPGTHSYIVAAIGLAASVSLLLNLSCSSLGLVAAGGYLYLALLDINFNLNNNMYAYMWTGKPDQKTAMLLEAAINVACIFISVWNVVFFGVVSYLNRSPSPTMLTEDMLDQPLNSCVSDNRRKSVVWIIEWMLFRINYYYMYVCVITTHYYRYLVNSSAQ